MKQQIFEKQRQADWERFALLLDALESPRKKKNRLEDSHEFLLHYRRLCRDLSLAQERFYSSHLLKKLNALVMRGHQQLYQTQRITWKLLFHFLFVGFPVLIRQERLLVGISAAALVLPALLMGVLTFLFPELAHSVFESSQINEFESMYDSIAGLEGKKRESDTDFGMFGFYIYNNISVSFRTFASGILFGLGSLFFLIYNGIFMGTLAGYLQSIGNPTNFYAFVIGHGSFELTAIVFSGAAGLKLAQALILPGNLSRLTALKEAGIICAQMLYGIIAMLVLAAYVEAFWSSSSNIPLPIKFTVGTLLWGLIFLYFFILGRNRGSESY